MYLRALDQGYVIREIDAEAFAGIWAQYGKAMFEGVPSFRFRDALSEEDTAKLTALRERLGEPYRLHLGLYHGERCVGWSWGLQETAETFYMVNSAVFPEHRGKGLYRALVDAAVEVTTALGFQKLYSRHVATNNAVIVPKLKAGFVITGLELSDGFGTLVHLTYFPSALRRKVLSYRAGLIQPDPEIKDRLQL